MRAFLACCLAAVTTGLVNLPALRAEEPLPRRQNLFFPRSVASRAASRVVEADVERAGAGRDLKSSEPAAPPADRAAARIRPRFARPVSWSIRLGAGSLYPAASGQTAPVYDPAYPAGYGAPTAVPMTTINPYKYSYAGRYLTDTCYSPVYNSGYYTSGCYGSNACCRSSRRYCTLFGGMFRGCSSGCYTSIPPVCPSTCAYASPCYPTAGGTYAAPAYGTPTPVPTTAPPPPPKPAPPPAPVENKVTPEPQAKLSPRIPVLPPDA